MKIFEITQMDTDPSWKSMGYRYGVPIDYKPAPYIWTSIKLAYQEAKKQNKKVVLTVGNKFKLANLDDPATGVIPNPNLDDIKASTTAKVSALKSILHNDREQVMKLGGFDKVRSLITKLNKELQAIPIYLEVK